VSNVSTSAQISGWNYVGGLAGSNTGTMTYVSAGGAVNAGTADMVGGLVGLNEGTVSHASATAAVSGDADVGGLVGLNIDGGTVTDAWASGSVVGVSSVGGLVGGNASNSTVRNAFATGAVNGVRMVGGLAGSNSGTVVDAYSEGSVSGTDDVGGLIGLKNGSGINVINSHYNADQVAINGVFHVVTPGALYDSQYQAWMLDGLTLDIADYASLAPGSSSGTYLISSVQGLKDLLGFSTESSYSFRLTADLDLAEAPGLYIPDFRGTQFDGEGHTIANLSIAKPFVSKVGMFGIVSAGSTVTNLRLVGATVSGSMEVGALAGSNYGVIVNCSATGSVTGPAWVGGLVGENGGTVRNSYAAVSVTGDYITGGLIGESSGYVNNVYATGSVTGDWFTGGLIGENHSFVGNAYATGSVTGTDVYTGGLIGASDTYGYVMDTYATGPVSGADAATTGGLVGSNSNLVYTSFWNITTSGQSQSAGGIGKTTDQMKDLDTFTDWSIDAVGGTSAAWRIYDGYTAPLLRSFLTGVTVAVSDGGGATYNGTDQAFNVIYDAGGADTGPISTGNATFRNAGRYYLGDHLYSSQQGYDISYTGGVLDIARAVIAVSGITAADKVYDAKTNATLSTAGAAIAGVVFAGDELSVGSATGAFADKNAATGKNVAITDIVLTGASASNYVASSTAPLTASITRASITNVTGINGRNRTYNATTNAPLSIIGATFVGKLAGDVLTVGSATGTFADKNAATGKSVTITGITLGGVDAGNYTLTDTTATTTANITRANITFVAGITAADKVYDTNTTATLNTTGAAFTGMLAGDQLNVSSATGTFATKNAAAGKNVTIRNIALGGADAGNYTLSSTITATTTARITPATITSVTGITAADKVYNGTTAATLNTAGAALAGVLGVDQVSVNTATGAFADKNAATGKNVAITGITLAGTGAGNYVLASNTATTTASITRASIANVNGITGVDKVYDANTTATLNTGGAIFTGKIAGDQLSVGSATSVFADKNAATGKSVAITGIALGGVDAGNYTLTNTAATATASISRANITAVTGIIAADKVYDTNTTATLNTGGAIFTGKIAGDQLSVGSATSAFADKNAATGKSVAITGIALGGVDAGNYTLTNTAATATASISRANITAVTGIIAADKVYDTNTSATLNTSGATLRRSVGCGPGARRYRHRGVRRQECGHGQGRRDHGHHARRCRRRQLYAGRQHCHRHGEHQSCQHHRCQRHHCRRQGVRHLYLRHAQHGRCDFHWEWLSGTS
jgi:hypothetical protein